MTNRRAFLQSAAALAALPAVPGVAGAAGGASVADVNEAERIARFDAGAARDPRFLPLKGVSDATSALDAQLKLTGRWPADLRGRFYRNGPALFERGGRRYHHWFDGDGMVQQFTFAGSGDAPRVSHRGRLVATSKLARERQAGRFVVNAFGTGIAAPLDAPPQGPDTFNTANTNAIEHAGRVLAMWEGGSAYALDPADLATRGPVTWGEGLAQVPFSAHPKVDAQGHLWNIGTSGRTLVLWHIDPQGQLVSARPLPMPLAGAMVHDMAVTARHIVVPIPPLTLHLSALSQGGTLEQAMRFHADQPLRILVIDKNDVAQRRVFELPPQMVFHVGNAFERGDGRIELTYVGADDAGFLTAGAAAMMLGEWSEVGDGGRSSIQRVVLDMQSGRVQHDRFDDTVEFPRVDPRRVGEATRWLLTPASWRNDRPAGFFHGLQLRDTETGRVRRFDFGAHTVVEEHLLVPKRGASGELQAWIIGTSFDARRRTSQLSVLDAERLEDGPVAQATLPYILPYGFHGNFMAVG